MFPRDVSGSMQGDAPKVVWQEALSDFITKRTAQRAFWAQSRRFFMRGKPQFFLLPDPSRGISGTDMQEALKTCMESLRESRERGDLILIITDGEDD